MQHREIDSKTEEWVNKEFSLFPGDIPLEIVAEIIFKKSMANSDPIDLEMIRVIIDGSKSRLQTIKATKAKKEKEEKQNEALYKEDGFLDKSITWLIAMTMIGGFLGVGALVTKGCEMVADKFKPTPQDEWEQEVNREYNKFKKEAEKRGIIK